MASLVLVGWLLTWLRRDAGGDVGPDAGADIRPEAASDTRQAPITDVPLPITDELSHSERVGCGVALLFGFSVFLLVIAFTVARDFDARLLCVVVAVMCFVGGMLILTRRLPQPPPDAS